MASLEGASGPGCVWLAGAQRQSAAEAVHRYFTGRLLEYLTLPDA
jgi:hypothetical protein